MHRGWGVVSRSASCPRPAWHPSTHLRTTSLTARTRKTPNGQPGASYFEMADSRSGENLVRYGRVRVRVLCQRLLRPSSLSLDCLCDLS